MKMRSGFVSNSSSSSFVVRFDEKPGSVEELKKILFGDATYYANPYGDGGFTTEEVAGTVWNDLKDQKPMELEQVAAEFNDYSDGTLVLTPPPERPEFPYDAIYEKYGNKMNYQAMRDTPEGKAHEVAEAEYDIAYAKWSAESAQKIMEGGGQFFKFNYADENGEYFSALEHGNLFDNLKFLRFSHH